MGQIILEPELEPNTLDWNQTRSLKFEAPTPQP